VSNGGSANLTVTQVRLAGTNTGDYRIASSSCATVMPGASCAVVIKFAPKSTGAKYATVQIIDDASGSPQKVALAGTGR
jgi:Abnormal spindle-like microcephaly-assoc'd, ASPM-SPD-2-Hydin